MGIQKAGIHGIHVLLPNPSHTWLIHILALSLATLALLFGPLATADEPFPHRVTLTDAQGDYPLGQYLSILEDPTRSLQLDDVIGADYAAQFTPSTKEVPGFGFSASVYWVRAEIERKTTGSQDWLLEFGYPPMQWIDVYTVYQDGRVQHQRGGSAVPFTKRPYEHHKHIFPLTLPPGQTTSVYVRVDGESSKTLPLRLYRSDTFAKASGRELVILSLYAGIIIALFCYNLFIYATLREYAYLYYMGCLAVVLLFFMSLNGVSQILLLSHRPEWGVGLIQISIGLFVLFAIAFTQYFINTQAIAPRLHRLLIATFLWAAIGCLLPWVTSYRISNYSAVALGLVTATLLFSIGVIGTFKGNVAARYFLLAWTVFLLGAIMNALRLSGFLPTNPLTEYTMLWGSAAEVILLSVALAARMRTLKEEKEAAQQAAIENHELALKNQQQALESERKSVANLQRMDQLKDEFLANTSHELRTPLNGIIGLAEASLHHAPERLDPMLRDNLQMIVTSGRRLGALVNDILDFSKLNHEDIVLSPKALDVRALTDLVIALSRPLIRDRPILLCNEMPPELPRVWADENRLQQILHNLIGNALKFTHEGRVTVSAELRNGRLFIAVSDTGIGIPADRLDTIFESFNQGDGSIQREFGGTGLGLSISKKLVELHGGSIDVSSRQGEGSCFCFSLALANEGQQHATAQVPALRAETTLPTSSDTVPAPIEAAGEEKASTPAVSSEMASSSSESPGPASAKSSSGYRILVVDDEPINRQVLKAQLGSAGFAVTEAVDGQQALALLAAGDEHFDLVLLDVMMPKLSGFDTCAALRQQHPALILPVIFLTAKSQTEDVLAGFAAGGSDYLIKPFSRDELLARIRIHLELISTHRIIQNYSKNLEGLVQARTRELVEAQQQLVVKQKQAAMGVLTAGVAHEINNPNNFIQAAVQNASAWKQDFKQFLAELLNEDADPEISAAFANKLELLEQQIELIDTGSRRIDNIVKALRIVTQLDAAERRDTNVVEGLEKTLELLNPTLADNMRFEQDFHAHPTLSCYLAELNQVFMNVLMNAVHAIEDKQQQHTPMTEPGIIRVSSAIEAGQLVLSIEDNGIGMTPEILARACDPFFTTREVGSGSGLGLSISRDIVLKHGGELVLTSTPNAGTTVRIRLPM